MLDPRVSVGDVVQTGSLIHEMQPPPGRKTSDAKDAATLVPSSAAARAVATVLGAITGAVLLAFLAAFAVNRFTPASEFKEFLDVGAEGNLPTWWNATLLTLVGAAALVAGAIEPAGRKSALTRAWIVVAAAGAYLSIDEAVGLHERLAGLTALAGLEVPTYAWVVPGSFLAAAGSAILVVAGRALPSPTAQRLGVALVAYGTGALGLEAFTGWIQQHEGLDWLFTVGITAEESLEMFAAAYGVSAIIDYCGIRQGPHGISLGGPAAPDGEVATSE